MLPWKRPIFTICSNWSCDRARLFHLVSIEATGVSTFGPSYNITEQRFYYGLSSLALPALGHWGTCPLDFQLFKSVFLVISEPHKVWHWTLRGCQPWQKDLSFCHCSLHEFHDILIFACLFSLRFVLLLAPNPGDATGYVATHWKPV